MSKQKTFYITTPIYYLNAKPHLGHCYCTVNADIIARFMRLDNYDVKFLTGTDEHGQKVQQAAEKAGKNPQEFVDELAAEFEDLAKFMNCSHDDFIRTTQERHKKVVQKVWDLLLDKGYIYKGKYSGWYCVRGEAFYTDKELIDGKSPYGEEVEWCEEENYFFKLSAFQDKLLKFYEKNPEFIQPASKRNEVLSFVKGGLQDLSISRSTFDWGIKVPNDEKHVIYVWLDALTNYISALDYPNDKFEKYWNQTTNSPIHFVGKEISRFHCVYWPAFLMGAEIKLPKKVFVHGWWWATDGQKMSKSIGNVVAPKDEIENLKNLGVPEDIAVDMLRYFLASEMTFGNDGNFSRERFIERMNTELVNNIGNLSQRVLSMVYKNCDNKITDCELKEEDKEFLGQFKCLDKLRDLISKDLKIKEVSETIISLSSRTNEYLEQQAPWNLKKTDLERMKVILYVAAEAVRQIAILLQPFCPVSANKILDQLNIDKNKRTFENLESNYYFDIYSKDKSLFGEFNIGCCEKPVGVFPRVVVG